MKKPFLSFFRALTFTGMATALIFISSCGSDDDGPDPDEPEVPTQNILEIAQAADNLDSLVKYLSNYPDLVATLESAGPLTVFAPTNAAFIELLNTPGFPEDITDINPDIIKGVLAYHVVPGQAFLAESISTSATLNTAFTDPSTMTVQTIGFNEDGSISDGSIDGSAPINTGDVLATNGVVHIVDNVLIPPSVGATLTPILGTNAGTLLLGANFTLLAEGIRAADTWAAANQQTLLYDILRGTDVHTVFAPTDATLGSAQVTALTSTFTDSVWYAVIAHHVVIGDGTMDENETVDPAELTNGATFTSALGLSADVYDLFVINTGNASAEALAVNPNAPGIFFDSNGDFNPEDNATIDAEVVVPNAAVTQNGVVHVIGGVLRPAAIPEEIIAQ